MSELIGDEMLLSLWPDHFLNKAPTLDWLLKDQQIVQSVPVVLLNDGRVAFKSDDGQICLVDGLQGAEEGCQTATSTVEDPTAELPPLSDATIKSLLVQDNLGLDSELGLVGSVIPDMQLEDSLSVVAPDVLEPATESSAVAPLTSTSPIDDELNLVSFTCQFCTFSSADVPSLMEHARSHDQPEQVEEETINSAEDIEFSLPQAPADTENPAIEQLVYYLCSECKEAFSSLTLCRDHMIEAHNMVLDVKEGKQMEEQERTVSVEDSVNLEDEEVEEIVEVTEEKKEAEVVAHTDPPTPTQKVPASSVMKGLLIAKLPKPRGRTKEKECDPEFNAKPHKCPEPNCMRRFSTANFLLLHQSCHTQQSFCCCECSMLFYKWGTCALHLWKEHGLDTDLYDCDICGKYKTNTRRKLQCHKKIHSDERPYKCKVCEKGFKQPSQLINHTTSVHHKDSGSEGGKWYMAQKCEICLKTYADAKCLKKHMQAVHSKLKPYKCHICGHMSARKAMMQVHIRQHTGEKPFACSICSFRTGDHNSFRRHKMRHTGEKPYKCPHCSYSSIQSTSFKTHLLSRHPGLSGAFICGMCQFITVNEKSYEMHMSDHRLNLIPAGDNDVFPENMAAASLVYHSFGASRCDITASATSRDGLKQTITIAIPHADTDGAVSDDDDTTHCFLPDTDTGGITIPAEPEDDQTIGFT